MVVAELVLAQGVEGDVAGRRGIRRRTLEVLGEADRQRAQGGDAGVDPQRLGAGLDDLPAHQVEQVGLDDQRRPDRDDAAPGRRQRVHRLRGPPRRRAAGCRGAAGARRRAPRSCARRSACAAGWSTRTTATARSPTVTRSGSSVLVDVEGQAADDERQGDDEHDQAAGGDDHQLDPAELPAARRRRRRARTATVQPLAVNGILRRFTTRVLRPAAASPPAARPGRGPGRRARRRRPCPARPRASAACGGPSRPGRRCARRRA